MLLVERCVDSLHILAPLSSFPLKLAGIELGIELGIEHQVVLIKPVWAQMLNFSKVLV